MYKVGICDGNIASCSEIERHLLQYSEQEAVRIETEVFLSGQDLCRALEKEKMMFQLLFLDIELRDMDGISVGSFLREKMQNDVTQIVFISGSRDYAMQLFKIRPLDFLIKPLDYQEVYRIMKVYQRLFPETGLFFEYRKGRCSYQVAQSQIICVKCSGKKICLITSCGELEFYGKMADVISRLDSMKFWIIHKSFIINTDYVFQFGRDEITMVNGESLPVSKAYKKEITDKLLKRQAAQKWGKNKF